ncbi:RNA polymerase, sigma-24 subunit, ECF subfamily [Verrucomicrobia bacterium]|nr:RNA polymerase, sigma-24 subunit, ECF subfamily [Verrucomicrobiota bacterium]
MASAAAEHPEGGVFKTTHWSVVLAAGDLDAKDARAALTRLCQTYWYPLYCCVRRYGHSPEDAQDLTQAFFAKLLSKNQIALAEPERGRFRTFLLRSLENFLRTQHRDATTEKRGGGHQVVSLELETAEGRYQAEPADSLSPSVVFERQWVGAVLEEVLTALRKEFSASGRLELFDALEPHLWGDNTSTPYGSIAEKLEMTVVSVRVTLHRLRQRFHELLRAEISNTLESPDDVEDELRYLRRLVAS